METRATDSARGGQGHPWRTALETVSTLCVIGLCVTLMTLAVRQMLGSEHGQTTEQAGDTQRPGQATARTGPPHPGLPLPSDPLSLDGAMLRGQRTAKAAIVEFTDLQCPYCGLFARETLPRVLREDVDTGKVLFALREFPLESIHPFALHAADALECAGLQGRFWEMHDALFADQSHLDDTSLARQADALGINGARFQACLNGRVSDKVRLDTSSGRAVGVSGTPTFFIGRLEEGKVKTAVRLAGAQSWAQIAAALDRLLANK